MLFKEIHEIVFHGKGGYSTETLYNMPIWWRRFIFNSIKEYYDKQEEARNEQQNKLNNKTKSTKIDIPKPPTYTSKIKST